jgi:hypothetical protein
MKMPFFLRTCSIFIFTLLGLWNSSANSQNGWPLDPIDVAHPLGHTLGQYQNFNGIYMHAGIDILAIPKYHEDRNVNPNAPWVRPPVSGTVVDLSGPDPGSEKNGIAIRDEQGVIHRYWHLEYDSCFDSDNDVRFSNGERIVAGSRIAQVYSYGCGFSHLHYELESNGQYLNPLSYISPLKDVEGPAIENVFFVEDDSLRSPDSIWKQFPQDSSGVCTVVSGKVDIIVKYRDRDNAAPAFAEPATSDRQSLGAYYLRWKACPESDSNCPWKYTYRFDTMDTSWGFFGNNPAVVTTVFYSNRDGDSGEILTSDWDFCGERWFYAIVTNFVGGAPDAAGSWNTTSVCDGTYVVRVEALDFAQNRTTPSYSTRVCVQNGQRCPDGQSPDSPENIRILAPK